MALEGVKQTARGRVPKPEHLVERAGYTALAIGAERGTGDGGLVAVQTYRLAGAVVPEYNPTLVVDSDRLLGIFVPHNAAGENLFAAEAVLKVEGTAGNFEQQADSITFRWLRFGNRIDGCFGETVSLGVKRQGRDMPIVNNDLARFRGVEQNQPSPRCLAKCVIGSNYHVSPAGAYPCGYLGLIEQILPHDLVADNVDQGEIFEVADEQQAAITKERLAFSWEVPLSLRSRLEIRQQTIGEVMRPPNKKSVSVGHENAAGRRSPALGWLPNDLSREDVSFCIGEQTLAELHETIAVREEEQFLDGIVRHLVAVDRKLVPGGDRPAT